MDSMLKKKNNTVGLVLSGGGVKGMAHIGLIKALWEFGIHPTVVSGASAGALVGSLYANGVAPDDMLMFFKETPLFRYNFITINKPGLFDTEKYIPFLQSYFTEDSFENLAKELHVAVTNLQEGSCEFFSSGQLLRPLLASAALPPVFSPVSINGSLYADGSIMNNFPVEPLVDTVDIIIGCYLSSQVNLAQKQIKSSIQLTNRVNTLLVHSNSHHKLPHVDMLFNPEGLEKIGVLDKKGLEKAYSIGYEHAMRKMEESPLLP